MRLSGKGTVLSRAPTRQGLRRLTFAVDGEEHTSNASDSSKIEDKEFKEREMATTAVTTGQDAVVAEIQIAAPPERVFKALSTAEELQRWFRNAECALKSWEFDPRLEGAYRYETEPGSVAMNGVTQLKCHGHITEYDPPKVLAYTWYANWHDDSTRQTLVRWELTPRMDGTHVKVTHSGLSNLPTARQDYSGGWPGVVEMLKKFVEGER